MTTSSELCAELGISRQSLMTHLRAAQVKMRAFVAGTEDFPLLRSTWETSRWERVILNDLREEDERREAVRRRSAERYRRRRAP